MRKIFYLTLLSVLTICIFVMFTSCNEQNKNDVNNSISDTTTSELEETDDQDADNTVDTDKSNHDFEYMLLSDGTYGISKVVNTSATDITVPEQYNGKTITKIMSQAFADASKLTSLTIKNNIHEIEKGALFGCSSLKNLTLPFMGTKQSSSDPIGFIFGTTYYSGSQKAEQNFTVSNGMERYDNFYIPSGLEKVTVSAGTIHMFAFMDCKMIKEIVFEDGVIAIESGAFFFCDALESVSMGKGITEISDECFRGITSLKSVLIGENVTKIGRYAFDGCVGLENIVIPKKVTVIEKYAFDCCTGMQSIIFENTSGWYRDYGSASGTGMNVTDPALNVKNLTDSREYSSDRWKRR